jgi:hypothetical protein
MAARADAVGDRHSERYEIGDGHPRESTSSPLRGHRTGRIARDRNAGPDGTHHDRSARDIGPAADAQRPVGPPVRNHRSDADRHVIFDDDVAGDDRRREDRDEISNHDIMAKTCRRHDDYVPTHRRQAAHVERTATDEHPFSETRLARDRVANDVHVRDRATGLVHALDVRAPHVRIECNEGTRNRAQVLVPMGERDERNFSGATGSCVRNVGDDRPRAGVDKIRERGVSSGSEVEHDRTRCARHLRVGSAPLQASTARPTA